MRPDTLSVRPPSTTRLFAGGLLLTLVAAVGAYNLDYSRKEFVTGYFQPVGGELRVTAPVRGVVEFAATPGTTLKQGQPLAIVRNPLKAAAQDPLEARRALNSARAQVATVEASGALSALEARKQALLRQQALAKDSVAQAERELDARRKALQLDEKRLERQQQLQDQGMVSSAALDQVRAEVLLKRGDIASAERAVTQARWQVSSLEADLNTVTAEQTLRRGAAEREHLQLKQAGLDVDQDSRQVVTAATEGTVTVLATGNGDAVEQGQLLAKLAPKEGGLQALLLLSPTTVARVQPGQTVSLQLAAYPYQTYGLVQARIERVEAGSLLTDETALRGEGIQSGALVRKAYARVISVPARMGGLEKLQSGLQFQAAVEIERKSFLAWMVWPLLKHFS